MRFSINLGLVIAATAASVCVSGLITPTAASALESGARRLVTPGSGACDVHAPAHGARSSPEDSRPGPRATAATTHCFQITDEVSFEPPLEHRHAVSFAVLLVDACRTLFPRDRNDVVVTVVGNTAKVRMSLMAHNEAEARYEAFHLIDLIIEEVLAPGRVGID
ncbi:hypothetical protein [Streptacidiphilus rugosus]|uniref:hypothetical protein n=1 Tax=Streptacidiphilus rugosus TaxID=405783 RepID=UPI0012FC50B5|nr:hypothetical protein [Streptacidiphilus rugosus]